jgi:hypothetical protein
MNVHGSWASYSGAKNRFKQPKPEILTCSEDIRIRISEKHCGYTRITDSINLGPDCVWKTDGKTIRT